MSKVNSYKCDICGKVFHAGDKDVPYMNIIRETYDEDDPMLIHKNEYNHICPDCENVISKCIDNPAILKQNAKNLDNAIGLKNLIWKIYRTINPNSHYMPYSCNPDYYEAYVNDFISEYKKKIKFIKWLFVTCGALIGIIIGRLFA